MVAKIMPSRDAGDGLERRQRYINMFGRQVRAIAEIAKTPSLLRPSGGERLTENKPILQPTSKLRDSTQAYLTLACNFSHRNFARNGRWAAVDVTDQIFHAELTTAILRFVVVRAAECPYISRQPTN
jgi:hypothetical protein